MADRRRDEHGSMTLLAVGLLAALLVFSLVATGFTGLVAMQHRAAAAADLAALAAAASPDRACANAAEVAADNGAVLDSCAVAGAVVTVEVRIRAAAPFGFRPTITSRARAGPAELVAQAGGGLSRSTVSASSARWLRRSSCSTTFRAFRSSLRRA